MRILNEDFETGNTVMVPRPDNVNSELLVSPENPLDGVYSGRFIAYGGPSYISQYYLTQPISPLPEITVEMRLRLDQASPVGHQFIGITGQWAFISSFGCQYASRSMIFYTAGVGYVNLPANIELGQVYKIKIHWKRSNAEGIADGQAQLWLDDVLLYENLAIDNYDPGNVTSVRMGMYAYWSASSTTDMTAEVTLDDFYIDSVAEPPTTYNLAVDSSISGVPFTLRGMTEMSYVTPFSSLLDEGVYEIEMPSNVVVGADTYNFVQWEDASTNPVRTVNLVSDMALSSIYEVVTPPPLKGYVQVHAFVDGVEVAAEGLIVETGFTFVTPATIEAIPGSYTVRLTAGAVTKDYVVDIVDGQTIRLDGQLTPPTSPGVSGLLLPLAGVALILLKGKGNTRRG